VQSLGSLFTDGFQRNIQEEIITGIVVTVALALVFDAVLVLLGRMLMPWTRLGRANAPGAVVLGTEVAA
jgi:osmoprotectant transport system permease protein